MDYITLKNSDLKVSRLCMGCCPMGGHGWGDVSENDLIQTVHLALDNGVNFFDTADTYGLGRSEETLGKSLKGIRNKAVVATKFGVRVEGGRTYFDNDPKWIEQAITGSLKRLGTDYIDLYQIHYRDSNTNIDEVVNKLEQLKEKGYIRFYGLSNINEKDIVELKTHVGKFISFQNEYSLSCRKNEKDLLDLSKKFKMTPLTWGSLGQGILTGKYDINVKFKEDDRRSRSAYVNFHGEKLKTNLQIVETMRNISKETGKSIPSIAIRFILDYINNSVVLVGVKNKMQLVSNLEAMNWELSDKNIYSLLAISDDRRQNNDE